jgi:hypothetical protein
MQKAKISTDISLFFQDVLFTFSSKTFFHFDVLSFSPLKVKQNSVQINEFKT